MLLESVEEIQTKSSTFRKPVKIPPLPIDTSQLNLIPNCDLQKSELLADGKLTFANPGGFDKALQDGFFLLKIPSDMDLTFSDLFVENFYKEKDSNNDEYKGFKHINIAGDYQGYFDREYDQWENFYIEKNNWDKYLPNQITEIGNKFARIGINILQNVFEKVGIPKKDWHKISGGLIAGKGHQMLAFNHFRPEKNLRGTKLHRDSGWVTVLRSTEPGLIALIDEKIYAINPEPGYFIINFGSSIEVLTEQLLQPVRANIHGVIKTVKNSSLNDRTSYVIFLDSDLSENIYRYENNQAVLIQSMKDFARQEVNRTYDSEDYL